jgi:hypothetical protein
VADRAVADAASDQGAAGRAAPPRRWLSPFLLPTSTTTYFVLLVVLTVGSGATGYAELFFDRIGQAQPCMAAARAGDPGRALEVTQEFAACMRRAEQFRGWS